jgi:hypothetical protein
MAELRSHGIVREADRFERPAAGPWTYGQQQLGFNSGSPIFRWRWAWASCNGSMRSWLSKIEKSNATGIS